MALSLIRTLSDGTTIRVRTERTIAGTVYTEMPSRRRPASRLMRLGDSMYLVGHTDLIVIRHPDYAYASSDKIGAEVAMRFFVDSAESVIKHAASEGIDVSACYATVGE